MDTKIFFVNALLFLTFSLHSCISRGNINNINHFFYDDEDRPCVYFKDNNQAIYCTKKGEIINTTTYAIHYADSTRNLSNDVLSYYYLDDYKDEEYGMYEIVIILFDKEMNISEIRYLYTPQMKKREKPYREKLTKAIFKTQGNWHAEISSKWYVYLYMQKVT